MIHSKSEVCAFCFLEARSGSCRGCVAMKFRELAFVAVLPGGGENKRRCSSGPLGLGVSVRVTFASSHGMLPDSCIFQPPVKRA